MGVIAQTPNRIDLAGGTLDIYPLYLFEGGSATVNVAIQIYSKAEVERRQDDELHFHSKDLNKQLSFESMKTCLPQNDLELLIRAVIHHPPFTGIRLVTENQAPQGSGLGASSALLMAVSAALNEFNGNPLSLEQLIDIGANLEAQTIRIPTGKQDYLAAIHGGVNVFWFGETGVKREAVPYSKEEIAELESRLILSYTGIPHFSGENNWTIMRRYIDGESSTVSALRRIKVTALRMRDGVMRRDWKEIGDALKEEWENRKALAEGVTTPVVEHLMAKAREAGAKANKLCGAGGGGCMITWVDPDIKEKVAAVLKSEGAELLPFKVALKGLEVKKNS